MDNPENSVGNLESLHPRPMAVSRRDVLKTGLAATVAGIAAGTGGGAKAQTVAIDARKQSIKAYPKMNIHQLVGLPLSRSHESEGVPSSGQGRGIRRRGAEL